MMNRRVLSIILIYITGLFQGIALVTYPAAGTLLTNVNYQNLSSAEYGGLFIPMIVGAILASLMGGNFAAKWGLRSVLLFGLIFNVISLSLFAFSHEILERHGLDFVILLSALLFLGLGFGATLTILNAYVAQFFPAKISTGLTALHSLLGLGTAIAPLLLNFFAKRNFWWGDPVFLAFIFLCLFISALVVLDNVKKQEQTANSQTMKGQIFRLFLIYSAIVFFYGICETIFGNWATIYLHSSKGLTTQSASWALSVFWAMVTIGRIMVTGMSLWVKPEKIFILLPLMIFLAFLLIPFAEGFLPNILIFGFAGLACSACLPLAIGFAEQDFFQMTSIISGRLIAFYMLGYGFAAYGVGILQQKGHFSLSSIYSSSAIIAGAMALFVFLLLKKRENTQ